jgi:hypothetical protein
MANGATTQETWPISGQGQSEGFEIRLEPADYSAGTSRTAKGLMRRALARIKFLVA